MGTIFYFLFLFIFLIIYLPVYILIWAVTRPFDKKLIVINNVSSLLSYMLLWLCPLWRVTVSGLENVDKDTTYVIVPNHQSMYDIPLVAQIPLLFRYVTKKEVRDIPFINIVTTLRGDIPLDRGGLASAKKMLHTSKKLLSQGISIVIFAEGTRSKTGRVEEFKEGAFISARSAKVAILPVVIDGTWGIVNHKGFGLKMPTSLTMKVLKPIPADQVKSMRLAELKDHVHGMILQEHMKMNPESYNN